MSAHFDLEQQILGCWQITSELNLLLENVIENDSFTRDNISNVVLGLEELYQLKFDKCFRTFEEASKEYHAMRAEIRDLKAIAVQKADIIADLAKKLEESKKPKVRTRSKKSA